MIIVDLKTKQTSYKENVKL